MADNFSSDFLAGAQLVNMGWQRQERLQELQSQAAMRAIQERQLAAQAEMLTAHSELYRKQAAAIDEAKKQEQADLAAANDLYHTITETTGATPEEARAHVDQVLSYKNPTLGLKIQKIRTEEAKQKKYEADATPAQLGGVVPLRNENGETIGHAVQTGRNQMHVIPIPADKNNPESLSAPGKYARELSNARKAWKDALASGDEEAVQQREMELNDLQSAMEKMHPNKAAATKASMLMSKWRETYKAYLSGEKKYKDEADRLEKEITGLDSSLEAPAKKSSSKLYFWKSDGEFHDSPEK